MDFFSVSGTTVSKKYTGRAEMKVCFFGDDPYFNFLFGDDFTSDQNIFAERLLEHNQGSPVVVF